MATNEQAVAGLQARFDLLKQEYLDALISFLSFERADAPISEKQDRLNALHRIALRYFNAVEEGVGQTDLLGAHRSALWAKGFAETCAAVLDTFAKHHEAIRAMCERLGVDYKLLYQPSHAALASPQRLVALYLPVEGPKLRSRFAELGLPVVGFDDPQRPARGLPPEQLAAFAFGVAFLIILLAIAVFFRDPSPFQVLVFRVVLSVAAAAIGGLLPGFLHVEGKVLSFAVRAGGALAMFLLIYSVNPPRLLVGTGGCDSPYLRLRADEHAYLSDQARSGGAVRNPGQVNSARLFGFTIENPSDACLAVIKQINMRLLERIPDNDCACEARTAELKLSIRVDPEMQLGLLPVAHPKLNYKPKDSDYISISVETAPHQLGWDYVFRWEVFYVDSLTDKEFSLTSPTQVAFLPACGGPTHSCLDGDPHRVFGKRRDIVRAMMSKYPPEQATIVIHR